MGLAAVCGQIPKGFYVCLLLFGKGIVQHSMEFSSANGRKYGSHYKGRSDAWLEHEQNGFELERLGKWELQWEVTAACEDKSSPFSPNLPTSFSLRGLCFQALAGENQGSSIPFIHLRMSLITLTSILSCFFSSKMLILTVPTPTCS